MPWSASSLVESWSHFGVITSSPSMLLLMQRLQGAKEVVVVLVVPPTVEYVKISVWLLPDCSHRPWRVGFSGFFGLRLSSLTGGNP